MFRSHAVALVLALPLLILAGETPAASQAPKPAPKIVFTQVPTAAPSEVLAEKNIEGVVYNAPKGAKLCLYALGDRNRYFIQPWTVTPFVPFSAVSGKFSTETHGGYAFVALLVKPSYKPEELTEDLPTKVGGDILAITTVKPKP